MKSFYNSIRFFFGWFFRLIYPIKIVGNKENIPFDGKVILLSNHITFREIPAIVAYFPGYRHFMAKSEFKKKKGIATWFFIKMGAFFVDRKNVDIGTMRTGINYLKQNEGLTIFPEGTRNRVDESLQPIKSGAAYFAIKGEAPIVTIIWQRKILPFRRTYVYVGEPIYLGSFFGKRMDSATSAAATEIISKRMDEDKAFIDEYVANKRWKRKNSKE